MRTRAAVLHGVGQDWQMETIDLDPPRAGEVLVKMMVAGVCHSDDHFATGDSVPDENLRALVEAAGMPLPEWFPLLGGHEGAGIVEQVGPGVTSLHPGDHVAVSFIPACGTCRWCVTGATYLCDIGAKLFSKNMITDDTPPDTIGMLAVDEQDAWLVHTPLLPLTVNGAGDATAAMFCAHTLTDGPRTALERTAASIHGVLEATVQAGRREIALIPAQDELVAPRLRVDAHRLG